jgi:rubrerythrin
LEVKAKHKEVFPKIWSRFVAVTNKETMHEQAHTEEAGSTREGEASDAPRGSTEKPPVEDARDKRAREKARAKGAAKRSTEECADKEEQHNVKTKLKAATKDENRTKSLLNGVRAKASDLANRIKSGTPAYAWADSPANVCVLLALKQSVDDRLDDFGNVFLVQELRTLMHKYTDQRLLELMLQFANIEDDVKALARKSATIVAMHLKATA